MTHAYLAALLATVFAFGCDEGPPRCTPGASVACTCPGGGQSAQVCGADGTFGPCACGIASPTGAASTGAVPNVPVPPPVVAAPSNCVDPARDAARRAGEALGEGPLDPLGATVEQVDSDADGVPETVVSFFDFCGNAPTCRHWVYAPAGGECPIFVRVWERPM